MRLNGKKALVTGAAAGIGRAIAARLVAEGARVACVDIDGGQLDATVETLSRSGPGSALGIVADVGVGAQVDSAVDAAPVRLQGLDILINNAGINASGTVETMSPAQWGSRARGESQQCVSHVPPCLARLRATAARGDREHVVDHGNDAGARKLRLLQHQSGDHRAHEESRAARHSRELCLSRLRADSDHGSRTQPGHAGAARRSDIGAAHGRPEEIAAAFAWLASDEASYANGAALLVDGAASAGFAGCFIEP